MDPENTISSTEVRPPDDASSTLFTEPELGETTTDSPAFELPAWNPSPDQLAAWDEIIKWVENPTKQVFCFGGLGGSGKSFLTGRLAVELHNRQISVAYAAPTGKAALVLKKNLDRAFGGEIANARTIHSTIYKPVEDKKTGRILGWELRSIADFDMLVVDEFSMVADPEYQALLKFKKPILAVGDYGQLSPVGLDPGVMRNPDVRLSKIHRQAHGNPIIRLAHIARNGAPDDALKSFIEDANDERVSWSRRLDDAIEFGHPPDGIIAVFTNRMRRVMNLKYREEVLNLDEYDAPQKGEMIICLKNKKLDDFGRMIPNGMRGVIVGDVTVTQHHVIADVQFDEPIGLVPKFYMCRHQFLREKTFDGFDQIPGDPRSWFDVGALCDFGYSLTVHKSQGSGFSTVAVVMERALGVLDEEEARRWKYTAFSRAIDKVRLIFP